MQKMKMKLKYGIRTGLAAVAAAVAVIGCTDTWDEHYDAGASLGGSTGATLWANLQQDESLRPFATVLDSCGYAPILNGSQVFSVWAPQITEQEAAEWIAAYRASRANDEENPALHEFIRNHIALFNHQVSELTDDTVRVMNGKRMALTPTSFGGQNLVGERMPSANGVLYKIAGTVPFDPNIWEQVRRESTGGDDGLDSVEAFFRRWAYEVLDEGASVPGGIEDGKTVYLDSVMVSYNTFFNSYGQIESEDSLYWLLAPTNSEWKKLVERNRRFFSYHADRLDEGDSLLDVYSKLMVLESSFFNVRYQPGRNWNPENPDSICSTMYSRYSPGYNCFERPFDAGGVLYGLTPKECSNGRLYKTAEWNVPLEKSSFMETVKVEAENDRYIEYVNQTDNNTVTATPMTAAPAYARYVSGGAYLRVADTKTGFGRRAQIIIKLPNNLSGCPYDIKVVFASPLVAGESYLEDAMLNRRVTASLNYYQSTAEGSGFKANGDNLCTNMEVNAMVMDTVTVAEGFNARVSGYSGQGFPVCAYGEQEPRVQLTLQGISNNPPAGYASELLIDCVLFVPRPDLIVEDDN